jgi:hypothetical protein
LSWREVVPVPSRFWIRHLPRRWPDADEPRLDLYDHRIVWPAAVGHKPAAGERLPALAALSDVALVPPVRKDRTRDKANLVVDLVAARVPVLDQLCALDEESPAPGATLIVDLLHALLEDDLGIVDELSKEAWLVVPLLPVLSAGEATWAKILDRAALRRPLAVVGVAPQLSPIDRRRLVERLGEAHFEEIHHSLVDEGAGRRLEREFAGAVSRAGLQPFVERPQAELPPRQTRNRALATALAECGELWLRLARSEAEGNALLAAARHLESAAVSGLDLAALSREGNLAHLGFLSPLAMAVIDGVAGNAVHLARPALLGELRAEYLAGKGAT